MPKISKSYEARFKVSLFNQKISYICIVDDFLISISTFLHLLGIRKASYHRFSNLTILFYFSGSAFLDVLKAWVLSVASKLVICRNEETLNDPLECHRRAMFLLLIYNSCIFMGIYPPIASSMDNTSIISIFIRL